VSLLLGRNGTGRYFNEIIGTTLGVPLKKSIKENAHRVENEEEREKQQQQQQQHCIYIECKSFGFDGIVWTDYRRS